MEANVSICIPVYNGAKWLKDCLESACACTVAGEIIVCDDRSTDNSVAIAETFARKDKRVRVVRNPKNLGLVGNWNRCLELAKLEWIKFLFQDDRLQAGSVEKMVQSAELAQSGVEGTEVHFIAAKRNYVFGPNSSAESKEYYTRKVLTLDNVAPGTTDFTPQRIASLSASHIARNFIGEPSTVMFRRSLIGSLGNFDSTFRQICDLEYWLRVASVYGLLYVPEAVIDFTIHDDSVSAQNAAQRRSGFDAILLVDRILHAEQYKPMRELLSSSELRKLLLWLRVQTYELRVAAPAVAEKFFGEHPHLGMIAKRFGNGLLYRLARLRR